MRRLAQLCVVTASAIAGLASATAPATPPPNVPRNHVVHTSYDDTWSGVLDVFTDHNWAIVLLDKPNGVITTDWMNLGPDADLDADCGSTPLLTTDTTEVQVNVRVREVPDGVSLTINPRFRQRQAIDFRAKIVDCESRGRLEGQLQKQVETAAAQRAVSRPPAAGSTGRCVTVPAVHNCGYILSFGGPSSSRSTDRLTRRITQAIK